MTPTNALVILCEHRTREDAQAAMVCLLGHELLELSPVALLVRPVEFADLGRTVGGVERITVGMLRLGKVRAPCDVLAPHQMALVERAVVLW